MDNKYYILILALVAVIAIIPLAAYNGMGEEQGYFGGADDAASTVIEETGYEPWFSSIWEPPSGEIESLLFALQAAIGAIIIGYILGYFNGQAKERRRIEKELKTDSKSAMNGSKKTEPEN
ncbi:energy-coupling factor ABC transporter substrate-binding protein [Methanobacterium sp.]|jgi:cobalt/nickel transport protein|uniref:energy-coupling factor ABC transporter substrate-binding protein n=1 Tax=Methanobacterium sp. TaxID=2164 RepID=UPI002580C6B3|nr:energy-coupling factor ABC transporter substrate-binding protein [Methanobacterium sp.]